MFCPTGATKAKIFLKSSVPLLFKGWWLFITLLFKGLWLFINAAMKFKLDKGEGGLSEYLNTTEYSPPDGHPT